jgi:hypothetical protein
VSREKTNPFDAVFGRLADQRFAVVRDALAVHQTDPLDRDAFLMERAVVELIHDLRPVEGVGEGMDELVVLVHLAYLFWCTGRRVVDVPWDQLERPVATASLGNLGETPWSAYVRFPSRRIWGRPVVDQAVEPLDGAFVSLRRQVLTGAAIFGFHPARAGFSVVALEGPYPGLLVRDDGTPLFAPALAGGAEAGLRSVLGMGELLELVWRAVAHALDVGGRGVGGEKGS